MNTISWEQAVIWLKEQPDKQDLVKACYFDDNLQEAAQRFSQSEEWKAVSQIISHQSGKALDIGAGRGISSYALAKNGWDVTALEPDPSHLVGAGAIRSLVKETGLSIHIVEDWGERLPFENESFDLVYGRQVLHHALNLGNFCREASRVLRPGGMLIATREHVLSRKEDLKRFLDSHPLHHLYGGENAYLLTEYLKALENSGLNVEKVFGSYDTPINYFPMTFEQVCMACYSPISKIIGQRLTVAIAHLPNLGSALTKFLAQKKSNKDNTPGRLYTFVCSKPGVMNQ